MSEVQIVTDIDTELNTTSRGGRQPQAKAANEVDIGQVAKTHPASGKGLRTMVFYMLIGYT